MSSWRQQSGQASVEFVAVLPLVAVLVLVIWQAVVAGQAVWLAGGAARAAARASAVGSDAVLAARGRLPPGLRSGVRVRALGHGAVRVRVPVPFVGPGARELTHVDVRAFFAPQR